MPAPLLRRKTTLKDEPQLSRLLDKASLVHLEAVEEAVSLDIDSPVPLPKALPATKRSWAGFPLQTHADPRQGSSIFPRAARPSSAGALMQGASAIVAHAEELRGEVKAAVEKARADDEAAETAGRRGLRRLEDEFNALRKVVADREEKLGALQKLAARTAERASELGDDHDYLHAARAAAESRLAELEERREAEEWRVQQYRHIAQRERWRSDALQAKLTELRHALRIEGAS